MTNFERILETMKTLHRTKNADYSEGGEFRNFEESLRIGIEPYKGAFVRLMDKYTRCCNLINGHEAQVDEKLEDTLLDLATYSVIVLTLYQNRESQQETNQNVFLAEEQEKEGRHITVHFQCINKQCLSHNTASVPINSKPGSLTIECRKCGASNNL
jgi:hypothetical protein